MRKAEFSEPLELSAPLALKMAPTTCRIDPATGENCAWVHGIWQYLRILGLASTPQHHLEFYRDALASVTGAAGAPRILVSGAADYAMAALVLAAFAARNVRPEITVVDHCDTPLALNRWYAEHVSTNIETRRCDMLEFQSDTAFDAVCTHSFLVHFPPERRARLLSVWRQLLRPGGAVITVSRLRGESAGPSYGFSDRQAQELRAVVLRKAEAMRDRLDIEPMELARLAEVHARRRVGYPVRSSAEIRELFESAGFSVARLTCGPIAEIHRPEAEGPAIAGSGEYARILATRA